MVTGFAQRPYGEMYQNWEHPLSPHYQSKDEGWLPVHAQPDGLGWKDWIGLLLGAVDGTRRPARVVAVWRDTRGIMTGVRRPTIAVFGYDFDNMKARAWQQGRLPAFAAPPEDVAEVRRVAQGAVEATRIAVSVLQQVVSNVRLALSDAEAAEIKRAVWQALEDPFYKRVLGVLDSPDAASGRDAANHFLLSLRRVLLDQFDQCCPMGDSDLRVARRIVRARTELTWLLNGSGRTGTQLHGLLDLPTEGAAASDRKSKGKRTLASPTHGEPS
jgi:CRISPR system Cascade subunit CasA